MSDRRRGFSLVELLIVMMIMGILATLATSVYRHMVDKARMTQAQVILKHLQKTQATLFSENLVFTDNLTALGYDPTRYDFYEVELYVPADRKDFLAVAKGIGKMEGDWWTITRDGIPVQADNSTFR